MQRDLMNGPTLCARCDYSQERIADRSAGAHGYGKEALTLSPTPANMRYLERLGLKIPSKIERNTSVIADDFPDSSHVIKIAPEPSKSPPFREAFNEGLKVKRPEVQLSTAHHYQQTIDSYYCGTACKNLAHAFTFQELKLLLAILVFVRPLPC